VEFRILGPLEVVEHGQKLPLGGLKQRALLAILLLHANEVVSSERLIDELWGERPPATAPKALQVYISKLRKSLGDDRLSTRTPGYVLRVDPGELDLDRFERLVNDAHSTDPATGARKLSEALALWSGQPLTDVAGEPFAQVPIARLEELRLAAVEERIDFELALGAGANLVSELEALLADHPLREHARGQLMLALYRAGRQAEALDVYRAGRRLLADELGLEPGPPLQQLERSILQHDPALEAPAAPARPVSSERYTPERSILVVPDDSEDLTALLELGEPLAASQPPRELIVVRLVAANELLAATEHLRANRDELVGRGVDARAAAFTSKSPGEDVIRLATEQNVDLLLLAGSTSPFEGLTATALADAPCDVALLVRAGGGPRPGSVIVPFGAGEHDWAALELGAWISRSTGAPLRLIGAAEANDGRDASRLLADASLIVQRTAGIVAEPLLASSGRGSVSALSAGAGLLVAGFSDRWRHEGLGQVRAEIAASPPAPTVFVRRGLRPGGLAPAETRTRFRWSLAPGAS
jgi:DNA-binding SARP family transcriptional activator